MKANNTPQTNQEEKATYEKPAIIHRQVMESVASACDPGEGGKMDGDEMCTVINS